MKLVIRGKNPPVLMPLSDEDIAQQARDAEHEAQTLNARMRARAKPSPQEASDALWEHISNNDSTKLNAIKERIAQAERDYPIAERG